MNEETLFHEALAITDPKQRAGFLDAACAGQPELRAAVDALLAASDPRTSFLDEAAVASATPPGVPTSTADGPGTLVGPYKLIEQIGEGGFGIVYLAEQRQPIRRTVALKTIKPGMDTRLVVARFEAERQALALMDHPNIARVLDGGATAAGSPFFVMELVKGIPITRYCDENQLTPRERLELFLPVCRALQHAHQKGIIHRDLKPSNVMIAVHDGVPAPKVIDFGVAKALGQKLTDRTLVTGFGSIVGTLEYMSPEQAEFNAVDVDTRSDIYSLGVLLYELLTGSTPLTKERLSRAAMSELLRLIREEDPPRPSTRLSESKETLASVSAQRKLEPARLTRQMRGELDWIVMKCLEKDRNRRYETASSLLQDVEHYLNDEPVEAGPPSASYKLRKFARKYRKSLAAVTAFTLLLTVAAVAGSWLAVRATHAERVAARERDKAIAEKQRADNQAATARAVSDFLQNDLLGQSDIANQVEGSARNRNITVRELLDRAARKIEGEFKDQELTEAAIRLTLGNSYDAVGEFLESQKHLQRAVDLRRQLLGAEHPETLMALRQLGASYLRQEDYEQAERILQEALRGFENELGPNHQEAFLTRVYLAGVYQSRGQLQKAEQLLRDCLKELRDRSGEADRVELKLNVMSSLASVLTNLRRDDEAESLLQELLDIRRRRLGSDHPSTLESMSALAMVHRDQGRFDKALSLWKQALDIRREKLGDEHPDTLVNMVNLAIIYIDLAEFDQAEPLLEQVLEKRRDKLGPDHSETLITANNLATVYMYTGRFALAEPLLREVEEGMRKTHGPNHHTTMKMQGNLASCYLELGRLDEAEAIYRRLLEARRAQFGDEHVSTLRSVNDVANVLNARGRYEEAEPLYQEVYEGRLANLGANHLETLISLNNLALVAKSLGKLDEAERLFRQALEARRTNLGADHPDTLRSINQLGELLMERTRYDEAEPLLLESYESLLKRSAKSPSEPKDRLSQTRERLVKLYDAWGKPDEAARWREGEKSAE